MFHPILPITLVVLPVTVVHGPVTVPFVLLIVALVTISIRPGVHPLTVFEVFSPSPHVALPIVILHGATPVQSSLNKHSLKNTPLLHQSPSPMPLVIQKFTIISTLIRVDGLPSPIRQVVFPLTLVPVAVLVYVFSVAISHTVPEVTLIPVTIGHHEPTPSLTPAVVELTLVVVPVVKVQHTTSLGATPIQVTLVVAFQFRQVHLLRGVYVRVVKDGRHRWQLVQAGTHCLFEVGGVVAMDGGGAELEARGGEAVAGQGGGYIWEGGEETSSEERGGRLTSTAELCLARDGLSAGFWHIYWPICYEIIMPTSIRKEALLFHIYLYLLISAYQMTLPR